VRPVRLLNAAVTNDPNLKGMRPLANRSQESEVRSQNGAEKGQNATETGATQGPPVDLGACNRQGCGRAPAVERGAHCGARAEEGHKETTMKRVIEKLVNHLGLAGDATEDLILEKMQGLPGLTAVTDLQNSLTQAQGERDALQGKLKGAEDELVNRHLAEFEGVVTEKTKGFWTEQLLKNRQAALEALGDVAKKRDEGGNLKPESEKTGAKEDSSRRPLHNRATARPVIPGAVGVGPSTGSGSSEGRAVKIRNRAHEIAKGEGVAFSVAFRRAEKEICGE